MSPFWQALSGILIISFIPVVGVISLWLSKKTLSRYTHLLVSFAVGALLGNAIIHLLPEVFTEAERTEIVPFLVIAGILLFYLLEQFLRWHHSHEQPETAKAKSIATMSIFGDSVHNFLDGLLIAGSFIVDPRLGWSTVLAVILHEIPQEIADIGILFYAKWPTRKILIANTLSGLIAGAGVLVGFIANNTFEAFAPYSLALTAGGFIYIACTDLIPDLHQHGAESTKERLIQFCMLLLGLGLFAIL